MQRGAIPCEYWYVPVAIRHSDIRIYVVRYNFSPDIRDTVNYKKVMKEYKLGPNGGIVTALNLFSTKFGQVVDLVKKAGKDHKYCVFDTPGW